MHINNSVEHEIHKGFYYVPGYEELIINKKGIVIKVKNNRILKVFNGWGGYRVIYLYVKDKTYTLSIHRLLALTFITKPDRHKDKDYSKLEVNHINGIKTDNRLENLEWVTSAENLQHAIDIGLRNTDKVLARNILTNELISFNNVRILSRHFGLNVDRLRNHLKSHEAGYLTKNWHVFKYDDSTPWPKLTEDQTCENYWDYNYCVWLIKHIETNKIFIHGSLKDLCLEHDLDIYKIKHRFDGIKEKIKLLEFEGFLISFYEKPTKDILHLLQKGSKKHGVGALRIKIVNENNQETNVFNNKPEAAKFLNITLSKFDYYFYYKDGLFEHYKITKEE